MSKSLVLPGAVLLSALVGGGLVALFYVVTTAQTRYEIAAASLSDHYTIIRALEAGDTRSATRFLATLADGNVVELMEAKQKSRQRSDAEHGLMTAYAQFRKRNRDLYGVPDYVDATGRAEYQENLRRIQEFLEQSRTPR